MRKQNVDLLARKVAKIQLAVARRPLEELVELFYEDTPHPAALDKCMTALVREFIGWHGLETHVSNMSLAIGRLRTEGDAPIIYFMLAAKLAKAVLEIEKRSL